MCALCHAVCVHFHIFTCRIVISIYCSYFRAIGIEIRTILNVPKHPSTTQTQTIVFKSLNGGKYWSLFAFVLGISESASAGGNGGAMAVAVVASDNKLGLCHAALRPYRRLHIVCTRQGAYGKREKYNEIEKMAEIVCSPHTNQTIT